MGKVAAPTRQSLLDAVRSAKAQVVQAAKQKRAPQTHERTWNRPPLSNARDAERRRTCFGRFCYPRNSVAPWVQSALRRRRYPLVLVIALVVLIFNLVTGRRRIVTQDTGNLTRCRIAELISRA